MERKEPGCTRHRSDVRGGIGRCNLIRFWLAELTNRRLDIRIVLHELSEDGLRSRVVAQECISAIFERCSRASKKWTTHPAKGRLRLPRAGLTKGPEHEIAWKSRTRQRDIASAPRVTFITADVLDDCRRQGRRNYGR